MSDNHSVLATHTADPSTTAEPLSSPPSSYTYYHAGPLFTIAELHTNALLAQAIQSASSGKFIPILPQNLEQRDLSAHAIRDEDLRALLSCDLALFTYDGAELDAGTVVEYMVAKMADIPSVILRTDFRGAGDQSGAGDAWNLMSSNWPRTATVSVDAMVGYKSSLQRALGQSSGEAEAEGTRKRTVGESMIAEVAQKVVNGFETVVKQKPRLPKELRQSVYQWLALMPGFKNGGSGGEGLTVEAFAKLGDDKAAKGLL
jgi:nucleoside 2-deoxyribosyltransferase